MKTFSITVKPFVSIAIQFTRPYSREAIMSFERCSSSAIMIGSHKVMKYVATSMGAATLSNGRLSCSDIQAMPSEKQRGDDFLQSHHRSG
jgi:hypothetical protein